MVSSEIDFEVSSPAELVATYRRLADDLERFASLGPGSVHSETSVSAWVLAKRTVPVLMGTMAGHPTIKTGNVGFTTEVVYVDQSNHLARTINRWYRLGRPLVGGASQ
ncbi:hypothetical protein ASD36_15090 [Rhizobium sp. Root1334]|nr:hypothetical protein ASD36_15090 [Rhizobium sp. Root1334]